MEFSALFREPLRNGHSARAAEDGKGIRTLTLSAVTYGDFSEANTKITNASSEKAAGLWLEPGDVLIERSNTAELVGTARVYRGPRNFAIFPDLMIRARVAPDVSDRFVEYFLASERSRTFFRRSAQGIAGSMPKISQETIERLRIPLAPRPEQDRIVAEIEKQFTRLDVGVEALKRLQANLKRYRAAVLAAACRGQLGRPANAGGTSVASLVSELVGGHTGAGSDLIIPDQRHEIPAGWVAVKLPLVADVQLGQQRAPVHANANRQLPYVRAANITWRGLDLSDVKTMGFPNPARYRLRDGDVLLVEASGSPSEVGKPAIWHGQLPECYYQKTLIRLRPRSPNVLSEFLHLSLLNDATSGRFAKMAPGVGIVHITAERLREWPFLLPPTGEQRRIVAEVEAKLSDIDALEAAVAANLSRAAKLRSAVLRSAFEGRLVPQNRGDAPVNLAAVPDGAGSAAETLMSTKAPARTKKAGAR